MRNRSRHRGFILTALVIAITILVVVVFGGRIAASGGWWRRGGCNLSSATGATTQANVAVLRAAVSLYAEEHGGALPSFAAIAAQLTEYSDATGASTSVSKDERRCLGPYLRSVPRLPVGARKGMNGIGEVDGAGVGWIYDEKTGAIRANTTSEVDGSGRLYSAY